MSDRNPFEENDGLDDLDDFNTEENEFNGFDETSDFNDFNETSDFDMDSSEEAGLSEDNFESNEEDAGQVDETGDEEFTPKPFLKTPLGMVSIAAGVVAAVVVGSNVVGSMTSPGQTISQDPGFTPEPPVAQDAEFRQPFSTGNAQSEQPVQVLDPANGNQIGDALVDFEKAPAPAEPTVALREVEALKDKLESELDVISKLEAQIAEANQKIEKLQKAFEKSERERVKAVQEVADIDEKIEAAVVAALEAERRKEQEKEAAAQRAIELEKLEEKRKAMVRLPDLVVIDTSANGDMMIIRKVSNGRVFTLFKGERIITPFGRFPVTELNPELGTITVGDKYFIDKKVPPAPKPAATPKPSVKPVAKAEKKPAEPVVSTTMTLSAVFEEGKSFGVVDEKGEFNVYKIGDTIPGLGSVQGLNKEKELRVGNTIIKSAF